MTTRPMPEPISTEFTDLELWNMDYHLAEYIARGIREFAKYQAGFPGGLTEDEWMRVLDDMAAGFEAYAADEGRTESLPALEASLDLFKQWFRALWW